MREYTILNINTLNYDTNTIINPEVISSSYFSLNGVMTKACFVFNPSQTSTAYKLGCSYDVYVGLQCTSRAFDISCFRKCINRLQHAIKKDDLFCVREVPSSALPNDIEIFKLASINYTISGGIIKLRIGVDK